MADEIDDALSEYEPTDTESDAGGFAGSTDAALLGNPTTTQLSPAEESQYASWKQKLPGRLQSESGYDLRGFWKKNPNWSPDNPEAHMTDEFKLPNHPTFSNESRYYNADTQNVGGKWNGDVYVPNNPGFKDGLDESQPVQPSTDPTIAAQQALAMGNETANAQGGVGDAIKIQNEAKAQQLEDENVQRQLDEQENRDKQAEQDAILEKTHSEVDAAQKKYANFKFANHWRDASPANKTLAIIFSAVGGAAATRTGGQNEALRAMDDITEREYKRDLADLSKQENFIKWKREGEKDLVGRFEKERSALLVQQSERLKHMANYAQSQYLRKNPGATVEEAKNSELAAGLRQKAAETYSSAVRDIYKINAQKAAALARAKHAGGGGSEVKLKAFIDAVNTLKPGEAITPAVAILGRQAGFKPAEIGRQVELYRNSGAKSETIDDKKNATSDKRDEKLDERTVTIAGKPIGLLNSSKNVQKFADRMINYDDAETSLKEALAEAEKSTTKRLTVGNPAYDRAVLAIATVTTANASDSTTAHEANTIKSFGLLSPDAIRKTLEHVRDRKQAFMGQLQPLKRGGAAPAESTKVVTIKDKAGNTHRVTMGADGKYHSVE